MGNAPAAATAAHQTTVASGASC